MSASSIAFLLSTMSTVIFLCALSSNTHGYAIGKRNAVDCEDKAVEHPNYKLKKPMPKRAAIVLDRLLRALLEAIDNEELRKGVSKPHMDLQSLRQNEARGFYSWRCYFNVATCFGRK